MSGPSRRINSLRHGIPDWQMKEFDPDSVRDLTPDAIGPDGRLRILPTEYWDNTTVPERAVFGNRHGLYGLPTVELIDHLKELIGDRTAIEIGAGSGVLGDALGITATDSYQLTLPKYRRIYADVGQAIAPYGPNVEHYDAIRAAVKYKPQVIIGSWITHKYDPARAWAKGNELGVDEYLLLQGCDYYIHIGNELVHSGKEIWDAPHRIYYPPFVYSRAFNGSRDFIAVFQGTANLPHPRKPLDA